MPYLLALSLIAVAAMALSVRALLRRNRELETLNRIGAELASNIDVGSLLQALARKLPSVATWDVLLIALPDGAGERNVLTFLAHDGETIVQRSVAAGSGLTGRAMDSGETILWRAGSGDSSAATDCRDGDSLREIMVVPMRFGEEILGALALQSFATPRYDSWAQRAMATVARQAAIAIRNAALFASEQRARAERDEFFALVTHEIKSPLTTVSGHAEIAEEELREGRPDSAASSMRVVRQESQRILRLAEDLLDSSRLDAGHFALELQSVDLVKVVSEAVARAAATSTHRIELSSNLQEALISGDPGRLAQVVDNLISNAVKYSPAGSTVVVRCEDRNPIVIVSVSDSGAGVDPDELPFLFDPFFRARGASSRARGSGLGLSVCREIVGLHGGEIRVTSSPGAGSTFVVEFPKP